MNVFRKTSRTERVGRLLAVVCSVDMSENLTEHWAQPEWCRSRIVSGGLTMKAIIRPVGGPDLQKRCGNNGHCARSLSTGDVGRSFRLTKLPQRIGRASADWRDRRAKRTSHISESLNTKTATKALNSQSQGVNNCVTFIAVLFDSGHQSVC